MQVEIWSKDNCPFCEAAIAYFTDKGYDPVIKKLDRDFIREEILMTFPGAKTFPQIIINGRHTGGWDTTKRTLGIE